MNRKNENFNNRGVVSFTTSFKYGLRAKLSCLKVILIRWMGNLLSVVLLFKISENLLESKPFKTSCKLPYFDKNQLCMLNLCMYLICIQHPKENLIKIRTFL